ncbi:MAG: 16S rRNA processing protein RimM [Lachnospiraceae bacterium]|nr:16S rRNA processing protein RimM [Lachnospiraceae bacterium]
MTEDKHNDMLRVGVITSPHGVHGEVNVFPTTDDAKRFLDLKTVYIDTKKELLEREIAGVKFFKNMVILKFKDMDDRNEMEKLRNCDILINREDAVPLGEDEYFICDLIGCDIILESGEKLGVLKDVITTAANDVYEVEKVDGSEILIPAIRDCILETDIEKKVIKVHLLPGL